MSASIKRVHVCGNCVYMHPTGNRLPDGSAELICRNRPPVGHPVVVVNTETQMPHIAGTIAVWPQVIADNWCGQHKKQLIEQAHEIPKRLQTFGGLENAG